MSAGGNASDANFSLKIENEIIQCVDTGSSITPDASAFKSFACCSRGGGDNNAGDEESGFLLFVVKAAFSGDNISGAKISDDERNGGGVDMIWVDSQSSSGYSKKSLTGGDARFAGQRAVHVEATQGADGQPFLVAVLAQATPTTAAPQRLTVWVCSQLSTSNDEPSWTPCGWFDGTEVTFR